MEQVVARLASAPETVLRGDTHLLAQQQDLHRATVSRVTLGDLALQQERRVNALVIAQSVATLSVPQQPALPKETVSPVTLAGSAMVEAKILRAAAIAPRANILKLRLLRAPRLLIALIVWRASTST
jgi:hypothetical protein